MMYYQQNPRPQRAINLFFFFLAKRQEVPPSLAIMHHGDQLLPPPVVSGMVLKLVQPGEHAAAHSVYLPLHTVTLLILLVQQRR